MAEVLHWCGDASPFVPLLDGRGVLEWCVADRRFRVRDTVRLALYSSELPCGDASVVLCDGAPTCEGDTVPDAAAAAATERYCLCCWLLLPRARLLPASVVAVKS